MPRTAAIIQTRQGSTRLPRKFALPFGGYTLTTFLIQRLRTVAGLDAVVLAVPRGDDELIEAARETGVTVFEGDPDDVLGRMRDAAASVEADRIVRLTGDNPLIDRVYLRAAVDALTTRNVDYATVLGVPVGSGVEAFTRKTLEYLHQTVDDPAEREHVTLHLRKHPERFRIAMLETDVYQDCLYRLTVDEKTDYRFLRQITEEMTDPVSAATLTVCRRLRERPNPAARRQTINHDQMMKGLMALPRIRVNAAGCLMTD